MNLKQHLESKTVAPFLMLLATVIGLAILGKLTAEAVEAIKYLGGGLFAVRTAANVMERLPGNKNADQ